MAGAAVLLVVIASAVFWLSTSRARPVSLGDAQHRVQGQSAPAADGRPTPGVYRFTGWGSERLSLPPLSQSESPTMPGTVTLESHGCWVFRIDYSTHHWQTWQYCLHQGDLWEAGGRSWQLWSIGMVDLTNLSTFSCAPRSMALPLRRSPGQIWQSSCTGRNSSVGGTTVSAGPYQYLGTATIRVGGIPVRAAHFLRLRTESGAQSGTERDDAWFAENDGMVLRLDQSISVSSKTPFGSSTYSQTGSFALASLVPRR